MKKLLLFVGIVLLFSCEKEICRPCILHQYSVPLIPAWEKIVEFEACGNDLIFWDGKIDSMIVGDIIYITKTNCPLVGLHELY